MTDRWLGTPTPPVADGDPTVIVSDANNNSFPGLCQVGDTLITVYRVGSDHTGNDGVLVQRTSDDAGVTWSSATTIVDDASKDVRDASLAVLDDDTVVLTYTKVSAPDYADGQPLCRLSTDSGATWGAAITIPHGFTGMNAWGFVTAPVVELEDGDLIVPMYGTDDPGTGYYSRLARSTDGGATWAAAGIIAGPDTPSAGFYHQEPYTCLLDDGQLLCLLRSTPDPEVGDEWCYSCRSNDGGEHWTVPVAQFPSAARPACLQTPDGDLVMTGRRWNFSGDVGDVAFVRRSTDRGLTWSEPRLYNPSNGGSFFTYGQWLWLGPSATRQALACAMGFQSPQGQLDFVRFSRSGDPPSLLPAPPFDPATDLASVTGWWRIDDEGLADNDPINPVTDLSASGFDLAPFDAEAGRRMLCKSVIVNGHDVARSDGSNDCYEHAGLIANFVTVSTFTFWIVLQARSLPASGGGNLYTLDAALGVRGDGTWGLTLTSDLGATVFTQNAAGGSVRSVDLPLSNDTWVVIEARHEGGNLYASMNGGTEGSTAAADMYNSGGSLVVGSNYNATACPDFDWAELIICSDAESSDARQGCRDYLIDRYL